MDEILQYLIVLLFIASIFYSLLFFQFGATMIAMSFLFVFSLLILKNGLKS